MQVVFLSSTFVDLQPEREAVRDVILRFGHQYSGMEYFGSDPEHPFRRSLDLLRRSTIYVGVVAHRYGAVDTESGKSLTHLEYEEACRLGLVRLVYLKDPLSLVEPTNRYLDFEPEQRSRMERFKQQLRQECTVSTFSNADDLAAKVAVDVARSLAELKISPETERFAENKIGEGEKAKLDLVPMLGAPFVGKTMYAWMLAHSHKAASKANLEFKLSAYALSGYKSVLRGRLAASTMLGGHEAVGEAMLRRRTIFGHHAYALQFVDTAGENWSRLCDPEFNESRLRAGGRVWDVGVHLGCCSALAVFLEVTADDPAGETVWRQDLMCANIIEQLAREYRGRRFPRPVSLVLTKCDLRPDLMTDDRKAKRYFDATYPLTSTQTHDHLKSWKLFPTSALGVLTGPAVQAPEFDAVRYRVEPIGIWDPIIWLADEV
jgi:hypothetical protein